MVKVGKTTDRKPLRPRASGFFAPSEER